MLPSGWVLRAVSEFPATMLVLATIAERHGAKDGKRVVKDLVEAGKLKMLGDKKGARYGLPGTKKRGRK